MKPSEEQSVSGSVKFVLRAEGLCVLVISCFLYRHMDYSWSLFFILFMAPDISFLGYTAGNANGAVSYNVAHSYILPLVLGVVFKSFNFADGFSFCIIWTAHIGFDRALGYGLKYTTGFGDTHLGKIGKWKNRNSVD